MPLRRLRALVLLLLLPAGAALARQTEGKDSEGIRIDYKIQPPTGDSAFWSMATGVYASGLADWYTTIQFRQQGISEANPIIEPMADHGAVLAAVKLGAGSLVNYSAWALKKSKKRYWMAPQITWIMLNLAVSVHNQNQMRE